MSTTADRQSVVLIQQAYQALRANDRNLALRLASEAARLAPYLEEPWLILSALSTPKASLEYAEKALTVAPRSLKALKAAEWAKKRLAEEQPAPVMVVPSPLPKPEAMPMAAFEVPSPLALREQVISTPKPRKRSPVVAWLVGVLIVLILGLVGFFGWSWINTAFAKNAAERPAGVLFKPSLTPSETPTATATQTATATATQTASRTPTVTASFTATHTATGTRTATVKPTQTRLPATKASTAIAPPQGVKIPSGILAGEHWIDVDISKQRAYAYEGSTLVRSFVVSTGISSYPTVTGTYRIYVKYRYAPMSGVGWYLPNVPYVMYFYKGYGLHGTYWHNNFGTPMSHGCINFKIDDAAWVYSFTVVGTVVNLHY